VSGNMASSEITAIEKVFYYFQEKAIVEQGILERERDTALRQFVLVFEREFELRKAGGQPTFEGNIGALFPYTKARREHDCYIIPPLNEDEENVIFNVSRERNRLIIMYQHGDYKIAADNIRKAKKCHKRLFKLFKDLPLPLNNDDSE
jgi:hypothetical protein